MVKDGEDWYGLLKRWTWEIGNRLFRIHVDSPASRLFRLHDQSRFAYTVWAVDWPLLKLIRIH